MNEQQQHNHGERPKTQAEMTDEEIIGSLGLGRKFLPDAAKRDATRAEWAAETKRRADADFRRLDEI